MTTKRKPEIYTEARDAILELLEKYDIPWRRPRFINELNSITVERPKVKKYDYRCPHCGRLAFRGYLPLDTKISYRCSRTRCGKMIVFTNNGQGVSMTVSEGKPAIRKKLKETTDERQDN